jgi:hypothetical protein
VIRKVLVANRGEHCVRLERGVELIIGLEAISDPDERGLRTVMCILNGQLRPVMVQDRSIADTVPVTEKSRPSQSRSRRRPVRRCRHHQRRHRRSSGGRAKNRHRRGDEDGGRHRRSSFGHHPTCRRNRDRARRKRRPPGRDRMTPTFPSSPPLIRLDRPRTIF